MTTGPVPGGPRLLDLEEVQSFTLAAGVRGFVVPRPNAHTATILFRVPVGSRVEPPHARGAAHLLEHLFLRGTNSRAGDQLRRWIDGLGGMLNPFTTREFTALVVQVPSHNWNAGLDALLDMVIEPAFSGADVDAERAVVLEEMRSTYARPEQVAFDGLHSSELDGTGLERTVIGHEEDLRALTWSTVKEFHARHYTAANQWRILAVGGVDAVTLSEAVSRRLEGAQTEEVNHPPAIRTVSKASNIKRRDRSDPILLEGDYPYSYVGLGVRVEGLAETSHLATRALDMILGGGLSSRVVDSIREQRAWAYDAYSMYEPYSDVGLLGVFAAVSPDRTADALGEMRELVGSLDRLEIRDDELEVALGRLDGQARTNADSPAALCAEMATLLSVDSANALTGPSPLFCDRPSLDEVREVASRVAGQEWTSIVVQSR